LGARGKSISLNEKDVAAFEKRRVGLLRCIKKRQGKLPVS
jgi:hypothetical protein